MKKIVFCLILLICYSIYALEFEVKDFKTDENDLKNTVGTIISDMNDDPCAVLRIETDIKNDIFLVGSDVVKREKTGPGEFYFYISHRTGWVKFACEGYEPYQYQIPQVLKPKTTYVINLTTLGGIKEDLIPIVILTDPPNAKIFVDKTEMQHGVPLSFTPATYPLSIIAEGYYQYTDSLSVNNENRSFKYTLKPLDPGKLDIVTIPDSVKVVVDSVEKVNTPSIVDLKPGIHILELKKTGYSSIIDTIMIETGKSLEKIYRLQRHAGIVKTNIIPQDAQLNINLESYQTQGSFLVTPGIYKVEIIRQGYKPYEQIITVELDKELLLEVQLTPIKGKLNIVVSPNDTECYLFENNNLINNWKGSRYFQSMLIGKYTLVTKALGYETDSSEVIITENETSEMNLKLIKQSYNNALYGKSGNIFDLEKTYPAITFSTEGSLIHNENKNNKQEYYLLGGNIYFKTFRPLYIGMNGYLSKSLYEEKPVDTDSITQITSEDTDDNIKLVDKKSFYSVQGLLFLPFRFQPFVWYSYSFKNTKHNIEPAFDAKAGLKYYNNHIMLLASSGMKEANYYDLRDKNISIQDRINNYFSNSKIYKNQFQLLFLRNRINPVYVTYYSHNYDYFENEAAYAGDLNIDLELNNNKFFNLGYENSGKNKQVINYKSNLNLFFTSFLSTTNSYSINNVEIETPYFSPELLKKEKVSELDTSLRIHLIPAHDFNLFAGGRYYDIAYKELKENSLSKFEAIAGLTIRTDNIYSNLAIKIRANYLIDSKQIDEKYLHGSISFTAFY